MNNSETPPVRERDYSRGCDNAQSKLAYGKIKGSMNETRMAVLMQVKHQDRPTLKTICAALNKEKNQLSGRITDLKRMGYVTTRKGHAIDGCSILLLTTAGREALA